MTTETAEGALELRWYQEQAIEATWRWFEQGGGNGLIVVPTGGGKSLIIAEIMRRAIEAWGDVRFICVTHVKELVGQNAQEIVDLWPRCPVGVYSAGLRRRDTKQDCIFAGIQSVHAKAAAFGYRDIVIVDEAHLIPRKSSTMYRRFLDDLKKANPNLVVIGLTATPFRLDSGELHKGDDALFEGIIYDTPVAPLIEQGFLSEVRTIQTETTLDVTGVKTRGGEFVAGELERAVNTDSTNGAICQEIVSWGADRNSWLLFCTGVDHAIAVRDIMRQFGVSCEAIDGKTPEAERDRIIRDFKAFRLRCLVNVGVLTTGFNHKAVDLIAMLRPTQSAGLYVQIVGRGLRTHQDKSDCLILDFAENVLRHGPIDRVKVKDKQPGEGEAPTKICESCGALNYAGVRVCATCGTEFEFQAPEDRLKTKAYAGAILSYQEQAQWCDVSDVRYRAHAKPGRTPTLRVEYKAGLVTHKEWIALEHPGYARQKAVEWWRARCVDPALPTPATVDEALTLAESGKLRTPSQILVKPQEKFPEITDYRFNAPAQADLLAAE